MSSKFKVIVIASVLIGMSGCTHFRTGSGLQQLTQTEENYVISKREPGTNCKMVGGFFGYDTPCGNSFGTIPDNVQFSCIRKEITAAGGNYGVLDAVIGNGWYKGRIYSCPSI